MTKKYRILKIVKRYEEIPDGYYTTTIAHHNLVEVGYANDFDDLTEAEDVLSAMHKSQDDEFTIVSIYKN
jgi:hypothetical protein